MAGLAQGRGGARARRPEARHAGRDGVGREGEDRSRHAALLYDEPTSISWVQEKGETKSLTGSWTFEDLGDGRTRATYALDADPGRLLGLLLRGPAESKVRDFLLGDAAEGLKQRAEA